MAKGTFRIQNYKISSLKKRRKKAVEFIYCLFVINNTNSVIQQIVFLPCWGIERIKKIIENIMRVEKGKIFSI